MSFELLVEVTRNEAVESRHFGVAVVCDNKGEVLESWGDIEQLIFPRSALKPMLAVHLIESGASEHYALSDAQLSLACSSHQGQEIHQNLVESWLSDIGLTKDNLACGPALPYDKERAQQILTSGHKACRIHHNCSGKHTGYLTTALHLNMSMENYHLLEHPIQQLSLDILCDFADSDLRQHPIGIDGCGLPAPTMPLLRLGLAMARFANPANLSKKRAKAVYRLHQAIANEPLYIAGQGTAVSELIEVTKGAVLVKPGAEGVMTASLPEQGLGIAIKIADGNARARSVALLSILDHLGVFSDEDKRKLHQHINPAVLNSREQVVGEIRVAKSKSETILKSV